jgi:hypothetical protein
MKALREFLHHHHPIVSFLSYEGEIPPAARKKLLGLAPS